MSQLLKQIMAIPEGFDAYMQFAERSPEKVERFAVLPFSRMFLATTVFSGSSPLSLGMFLEHPDMPDDAEIVGRMTSVDANLRVMVASKEWGVVPEGMMPPTLELHFQRQEDGSSVPLQTGAKPRYHQEVRCPHCKHVWE